MRRSIRSCAPRSPAKNTAHAAASWRAILDAQLRAERAGARHDDDRDAVLDAALCAVQAGRGGSADQVELETMATRLAVSRRERARRRRRADRTRRPSADPALAAPVLCPTLVAMAGVGLDAAEFLDALHRAAIRVAYEPGVLQLRQIREFLLAYDAAVHPVAIADAVGASPRAVVERLRRAAARVESHLSDEIARLRAPSTESRTVLDALRIIGSETMRD